MNATAQQNPFEQFFDDYENSAQRFVREVLGATPDDWQTRCWNGTTPGNAGSRCARATGWVKAPSPPG